jgi:hypothetical protein
VFDLSATSEEMGMNQARMWVTEEVSVFRSVWWRLEKHSNISEIETSSEGWDELELGEELQLRDPPETLDDPGRSR